MSLSHVWHFFVIRSESRDLLQQYLQKNGIQTIIHYPIPPHLQRAYKEWSHLKLPVTELIHNEVLSLPISQVMSEDEMLLICDLLNNYK